MKKLLIAFTLLLFCCVTADTKREEQLSKSLKILDGLLREENFKYDELINSLASLDQNFANSTSKKNNTELVKTKVNYEWNGDSTISMIRSNKFFSEGFKKEVAIHINDSILIIHMFNVQIDNDTSGFTFIESIDYLTKSRTIRTLTRAEFEKNSMADTLDFRKIPFKDWSNEVEEHYDFELDYWQNVIDYN